jgi:hypothetical protein
VGLRPTNIETRMTLDDAIAEVLSVLTGLDLEYEPEQDRYQSITRFINRAMRTTALEKEWSYFSDVAVIGTVSAGDQEFTLASSIRPRIIPVTRCTSTPATRSSAAQ